MSEFRIKHIGIRTDSTEEAASTAALLAMLFDLSETHETASAVWAGDLFEVMRGDKWGARGHVAMQTDDVEAAMESLRAKGIGFRENTVRRNAEGKIIFVYLDREIAGFQFHLTI
nr:2-dehydro-3-deoxyphosphogluconate aldolase [Lachnospiraceae bacterium]